MIKRAVGKLGNGSIVWIDYEVSDNQTQEEALKFINEKFNSQFIYTPSHPEKSRIMSVEAEKSLGEKRVVLDYTPLSDEQKSSIKETKVLFAQLIDDVELSKSKDPRLAARVQTFLEDACMNWVKLIAS